MSDLQTTRTLDVVAAEIRTFTASMLNNIIEIGRRMCEAKAMLQHGEFGDWVKQNTGYSKSTANNFMRLFQEYGDAQGSLFGAEIANVQTFGNLSYTKALALLQVPSEEREAFVESHDVDSMTTRELEQAIKERDAAKAAMNAMDKLRADAVKDVEYLEAANAELDEKLTDAEASARQARNDVEQLRAELEELKSRPVDVAVQEPDPAMLDQIRAEEAQKAAAATAELEKKLAAAEAKADKEAQKAKKLKDKVDKAADEAKAAMQKDMDAAEEARRAAESAKADAEARAQELEKKLKTADGDAAAFKVYFTTVQEDLNRMMGMIQKFDDAQKVKYKSAVRALLDGFGKMVQS